MRKILVIDANSIINRAFYAVGNLKNKAGEPTNAVYGMINIINKHKEKIKPDKCAAAFDLRGKTFRHEMYGEYKAGRRPMSEELAVQFGPAKECLSAMGFSVISSAGYEADDILGTLSGMTEREEDSHIYIVTGDRDALQLIGGKTTVLLEKNKGTVEYGLDAFKAEYGIEPENFIDVKALMGDQSDNIPGVPGVGEKTAFKLIKEYGTIDALYSGLDAADVSESVRKRLEDGKKSAYMSYALAKISKEAPGVPEIKDLGDGKIDEKKAYELFKKLDFSGFIKRFGLNPAEADFAESGNGSPLEASSKAEVFFTEEIGTSEICEAAATGAGESGLSSLIGKKAAIDISEGKIALYAGDKIYLCSGDLKALAQFLSSVKCICYDCKEIYGFFKENSVLWHDFDFDVMLAAYVVDSSNTDLKKIARRYLPLENYEDIPRVVLAYRLEKVLRPLVTECGGDDLLYKTEMPLSRVLRDMEDCGFKIDCRGIAEYGEKLDGGIKESEEKIYAEAGEAFNINSPKQLGLVLFEKLGLPHGKKTKSGYSTSADILMRLTGQHPVVSEVLDYRQMKKLKSTYVDGLLKVADADGIVHTKFQRTGTATGRLSSAEPNLQNIPVRTEAGRELRKYFIPKKEGRVLIDADYSQIELRILAAVSGDENMTKAFLDGEDIHTSTAARVFGIKPELVTKEMRKRAKAVNFGIVYGIGKYSLSQDLRIPLEDAKRYIDDYLASYPKVKEYLEETKKEAKKNGFVKTVFGRRRYIEELKSRRVNEVKLGERIAMNSPIQGSAADIIKKAMVSVHERLMREKIDAHLILQVHDELILESDSGCLDEATKILKEEMENAVKLSVPLNVDVSCGKNWFECYE